jgi:hypothetical protein
MQRFTSPIAILVGIAIAASLATLAYQGARAHAAPEMPYPYSAVLMMNGRSYFGRLEGLGTAFPVLREVHYLRSQVNSDTKEVTNTLVKQGQELHAPDAMILNATQIVLIEPVKPGSQIGKSMEENKSKP